MDEKRYARRDTEELGELYQAHVAAMTAEGLHEKSAIAAELAHRDALLAMEERDASCLEGLVDTAEGATYALMDVLGIPKPRGMVFGEAVADYLPDMVEQVKQRLADAKRV